MALTTVDNELCVQLLAISHVKVDPVSHAKIKEQLDHHIQDNHRIKTDEITSEMRIIHCSAYNIMHDELWDTV
jgi:hypothetical protein